MIDEATPSKAITIYFIDLESFHTSRDCSPYGMDPVKDHTIAFQKTVCQ
jgi:hypothetical protein